MIYLLTDPPPPFSTPSAPAPEYNYNSQGFISRCMNSSHVTPKKRRILTDCGKMCTNCTHLMTLIVSLFTMILLVMVYFMPNPNKKMTEISRPSVSNIWFQADGDSWTPNNYHTWSSEIDREEPNNTIIEGKFWISVHSGLFNYLK